jgi:RNA recognition motif-containing protein
MNIFVANLNFRMQDDELRALFEGFGTVNSAKIILDHETGRSRGFGFVEMNDDEEAQAAIRALNNADQDGRQLIVKEARPRSEMGGGGGGGGNREFRSFDGPRGDRRGGNSGGGGRDGGRGGERRDFGGGGGRRDRF